MNVITETVGTCNTHTHTHTLSQRPKYKAWVFIWSFSRSCVVSVTRKETKEWLALFHDFCSHSQSRCKRSPSSSQLLPLRLTVEPRNSDDFQQDHSDDCRACGVFLKQLHHKRSSLAQEAREREREDSYARVFI